MLRKITRGAGRGLGWLGARIGSGVDKAGQAVFAAQVLPMALGLRAAAPMAKAGWAGVRAIGRAAEKTGRATMAGTSWLAKRALGPNKDLAPLVHSTIGAQAAIGVGLGIFGAGRFIKSRVDKKRDPANTMSLPQSLHRNHS